MLGSQELPKVSYCQLNVSQCSISETNDRFVVNVYNSVARNVDKYIRIPITSVTNFQVLDTQGDYIKIEGFVLKTAGIHTIKLFGFVLR